jgi:predicted RNA binding protein YcfA (HicA-like mRNA interferase family)
MTGKEMIKVLREHGWEVDRIIGSHHIMIKRRKTFSVPVHGNKDLKKGLQQAFLK